MQQTEIRGKPKKREREGAERKGESVETEPHLDWSKDKMYMWGRLMLRVIQSFLSDSTAIQHTAGREQLRRI